MNNCLDLIDLKFVFRFNFIMEASSTQKFKDDVKRVFRFKDFKKPHIVWVSKVSHNFDFFNEALLSFLFAVSCFFREGFYCILAFIFVFFYKVNRGKISFSDFV